MHLRRALLLFAIVLGLAAIAASLTPPPDVPKDTTTEQPGDAPDGGAAGEETDRGRGEGFGSRTDDAAPFGGDATELRFVTGAEKPERHVIETGERAVVTVATDSPGQVSIEDLGLLQPAVPGVPARFDILPRRAGTYEVVFRPVGGDPERLGVIAVEAA